MVRHSLRMMAGTFLSRILGLAREVLTAALFGATRQLDAFLVAYTLANLSRRLLAEGALSAAFVPEFSRSLEKDGPEAARSLARQTLAVLLAATGVVTVAGILAAPLLVRIMAPGFDLEGASTAVYLTRLMFPFLVFISIAALAMGVLNSLDCFFVPAIAPALSNVVFIAFLAIVTLRWGVRGLAYAVLLGGISQMVLQWLWSAKKGFALLPAMPRRDNEALARAMKLFLPYAAGLSLNQLIPLISRMLGSFLQEGAISVLNYADRVLQLPLGLFVIAISQAILPQLSRQILAGEEDFFKGVREALRFGLFMVLPVALGMALFSGDRPPSLLQGRLRGVGVEGDSRGTGHVLLQFPGMACSTILLRALARGLPREAMAVTAFSVVANVVFQPPADKAAADKRTGPGFIAGLFGDGGPLPETAPRREGARSSSHLSWSLPWQQGCPYGCSARFVKNAVFLSPLREYPCQGILDAAPPSSGGRLYTRRGHLEGQQPRMGLDIRNLWGPDLDGLLPN